MEREFALFEEKLLDASSRVAAPYFQLPVADADSIYRERVYCYELYHQLRCDWEGFPFSLGGEIDKGEHPHFRGGPYAHAKPDLLVHGPGDMDRNLACVEVKPCLRSADEFAADLEKLTWFCRHARYHRGLFLVYGVQEDETPERVLLQTKLRRAAANNPQIDLARVCLISHPAAGVRAERLML